MPQILDERILDKIAAKIGKEKKYTREQISKRASRLRISSEASQILWARELGIGTAHFQRTLEPHIQQQVRDHLPTFFAKESQISGRKPMHAGPSATRASGLQQHAILTAAIEYLLKDDELRVRCSDLLKARAKYDRVFREATTVLDDRLKKLAQISNTKIDPSDLVVTVLHPNNPILRISTDKSEQEGFFFVCKGLFQAFRNPTHHQLSDKFTREDALRFCGFVDALLAVLGQAQRGP